MKAVAISVAVMLLLACMIPATVRAGVTVSPQTAPYTLEDTKLGESLSDFRVQHPQAQCVDSSGDQMDCYQWTDVSIEGVPAVVHAECTPQKTFKGTQCSQGLFAHFLLQRLVSASYTVDGSYRDQIVTALEKRYGPTTGPESENFALWSNQVSTLTVVKSLLPSKAKANTPNLVTVTILSNQGSSGLKTSAELTPPSSR